MEDKQMFLPHRSKLAAAGVSLALVAGTLSLTVLTGVALPTVANAAIPAAPAGFTTTWSDDFTGAANTGVPTSTWKYDTGAGSTFGTGEIETMTNSTANVYEDGGGHLTLKALHAGTDPNSGWTSGRIETQSATFGAPAGGIVRMESSIQQPDLTTANGAGYWPAFWMLGSGLRSGGSWPSIGEVDILEDVNARSSVFGTLHCGSNPGGPCNESTGIGSGEHACAGCQTGYHDYAVEIDRSTAPEQIRYYLDGTNYFTIKASQVDATTWSNAVDHPFFIIYDLAMGGGFPSAFGGGPNAATISGGQMNIDWVAVYNKAPGAQGGTTTAAPTALARSGWVASANPSSGDVPANALDGNAATRFSSGSAMTNGQTFTLDLGSARTFDQVTMDSGGSTQDYARAFTVQTSTDGATWTNVTTGTGTSAVVTARFANQTARWVRIVQTGSNSSWWSIAELNLYTG